MTAPLPFAGTAPFYRFRVPYPPEVFAFLRAEFGLDYRCRVLDLGCGPGTLSIPLSRLVRRSRGARHRPRDAGRGRTTGRGRRSREHPLASLRAPRTSPESSGDSDSSRSASRSTGWIATGCCGASRRSSRTVEGWRSSRPAAGGRRRAGRRSRSPSSRSTWGRATAIRLANPEPEDEPALRRSEDFVVAGAREFPSRIERDVSAILGWVYSSSTSARHRFGERAADVRGRPRARPAPREPVGDLPGASRDRGGRRPEARRYGRDTLDAMIKLSFCLRRLPHLSREEFQRYWFDTHGPLVRKHADALRIRRYVQTHTLLGDAADSLRATRGGPPGYDGVAELWWNSEEDIAAALTAPGGTRGGPDPARGRAQVHRPRELAAVLGARARDHPEALSWRRGPPRRLVRLSLPLVQRRVGAAAQARGGVRPRPRAAAGGASCSGPRPSRTATSRSSAATPRGGSAPPPRSPTRCSGSGRATRGRRRTACPAHLVAKAAATFGDDAFERDARAAPARVLRGEPRHLERAHAGGAVARGRLRRGGARARHRPGAACATSARSTTRRSSSA